LATGKKPELKNKFGIYDSTLTLLHDSICYKAFFKYMRKPSTDDAEKYLSVYTRSKFSKRVLCMRDSFIFFSPDRKLTVEAFTKYIYTYPQSCYLNDARNLLEFAIYMETTAEKTDKAYLT